MTNGDMIKVIFPNLVWDNEPNGIIYGYKNSECLKELRPQIGVPLDWWNEPYKKEVEE